MKNILLVVAIAIVLLAFNFDGWGGYEKAGYEPRINYLPMRVYSLYLDFSPTPPRILDLIAGCSHSSAISSTMELSPPRWSPVWSPSIVDAAAVTPQWV